MTERPERPDDLGGHRRARRRSFARPTAQLRALSKRADTVLSELAAPTGNFRGQLLLVTSWIEQCLIRILATSELRFDVNIKKARKKNLIDDEFAAALTAIGQARNRAADRHLEHHQLFSTGPNAQGAQGDPLAVFLALREGFDDLERLTGDHQIVFQFAVAVFVHLSTPADHPASAVFPIRLVWRP